MKEYACPRYPGYSIGRSIQFVNGRLKVEDPKLIRQIESNDWYRVFIWPADGRDYNDDQASEGGIPTPQQEDGKAAGSGEVEPGIGVPEGREESPVLSELEELVRGSGIVGGKGKKVKSSLS